MVIPARYAQKEPEEQTARAKLLNANVICSHAFIRGWMPGVWALAPGCGLLDGVLDLLIIVSTLMVGSQISQFGKFDFPEGRLTHHQIRRCGWRTLLHALLAPLDGWPPGALQDCNLFVSNFGGEIPSYIVNRVFCYDAKIDNYELSGFPEPASGTQANATDLGDVLLL
jgi:hypothetical protein